MLIVVVDGNKGSGKSTVIEGLNTILTDEGYDVVVCRAPGTTVVGEKIRDILFETPRLSDDVKFDLHMAAHKSIQEYIELLIEKTDNHAIILDRSIISTCAYQLKDKPHLAPHVLDAWWVMEHQHVLVHCNPTAEEAFGERLNSFDGDAQFTKDNFGKFAEYHENFTVMFDYLRSKGEEVLELDFTKPASENLLLCYNKVSTLLGDQLDG